ncbi:MAG: hypothetical protein A3J80_03645 [Desulfobacula sp. RIFOXYB2_FULL_45_6]|nr:MAG: hypothetical protein A3J80_03645 [Desulfobacula sp. RIFOXYB2_FULL_45_6]
MVMGVALAGLIFSISFSSLTQGADLDQYTTVLEPFFLLSFQRAMMTGVVLSMLGIGVTLVRGPESK